MNHRTSYTEALGISQESFLEWRKVSFEKRQELLRNVSNILEQKNEFFAHIITTEMHKPISQSKAEIRKCALMVDFYTEAENVLIPKKIKTEFSISEVQFHPMGVILGIMPWNFPFWQALRFAIPTILAGNTVVLKHASICMESGDALAQLFFDAGFPKGVFQHIKVNHQEIEKIIANPIIKGVSLTGSEAVGSKIGSLAGKHIKKSVLELGGNDAFIVLDDADLEKAARQGAQSRLQNCGQTCIAAKRFIVHEKIYDDFLKLLIQEFKKYVAGNPFDENSTFSKMAREDLAEDLETQYQKALEGGAKAILPLQKKDSTSFEAGLLEMNLENPMLDEEFFGPLGMIFKAKNDEEILKIANNTKYGLGNSVWTKSQQRADFFIENLESGTVSINQLTRSDPKLPFGGTKSSGYGLELSLEALKEFSITKTVVGNL